MNLSNLRIEKGILTLIPTPIDDESPLEPIAFQSLEFATQNSELSHSLFVHEELSIARRRWVKWGLTRDAFDFFVLCNEHNFETVSHDLIKELQAGKRLYLMSDCGLPAFCDPGQLLVHLCHKHSIKVTSTPFPNSIALSVALSGYSHSKFHFEGFLPHKDQKKRTEEMRRILMNPTLSIVMDTPYRLSKLIREFKMEAQQLSSKRHFFLALDLNTPQEKLIEGDIGKITKEVDQLENKKREFVLILAPTLSAQELPQELTLQNKSTKKMMRLKKY